MMSARISFGLIAKNMLPLMSFALYLTFVGIVIPGHFEISYMELNLVEVR